MAISIYGIKNLDKFEGIYKTLDMYNMDAIAIMVSYNYYSFYNNYDI